MRVPRSEIWTGRLILTGLVIYTLGPFVALLSAALGAPGKIPLGVSFTPPLHWENFAFAFAEADFPTLMWSSTRLVLIVVPVAIALVTLAAYGLTWLRVPGASLFFLLFLAGLTVPVETLVTPLYSQMRSLGLVNTVWSVALPLIALHIPFGVFWMRSHFLGVPAELDEAAQLDGAGFVKTFTRIQLPLARPAIATLAVLYFLWTWNHFMLALVMIDDPAQRTMAGALGGFQGEHGTDIVMLCAAALLMMIPTLVVFLLFQRQFVAALLQGSVKG